MPMRLTARCDRILNPAYPMHTCPIEDDGYAVSTGYPHEVPDFAHYLTDGGWRIVDLANGNAATLCPDCARDVQAGEYVGIRGGDDD